MAIRLFLEKVDRNVTNLRLTEIINECVSKVSGNVANQNFHRITSASGDSHMSCMSPLQELLRGSPVPRKTILQEKEIQKLRSELEMERFEKADLQEELKAQSETNLKLGQ